MAALDKRSPDQVWARIATVTGPSAGYPRRHLPGNDRGPGVHSHVRLLVTQILRATIEAVRGGSAAAEVALAYFPRLFLAKGKSVYRQIEVFVGDDDDTDGAETEAESATHSRRPPKPPGNSVADAERERGEARARWTEAIARAVADADRKQVRRLMLRGPLDGTSRVEDVEEWTRRLFPEEPRNTTERGSWADSTGRVATRAARQLISPRDLRRWAANHKHSSGGRQGWNGQLIVSLDAVDKQVTEGLALLWSRSTDEWLDQRAANDTLRACDGWLVPQKSKPKPRPISAPQVARRVRAAVDAKRIYRDVDVFASERGQLGCAGYDRMIAYSLVPALAAATGGTTFSADRSNSFQTFRRSAILERAGEFVSWCRRTERRDTGAAFARMMDDLFVDSEHLHRTEVTFAGTTSATSVSALPQGCTLSPILEALALLPGAAVPVDGVLTLAAHDDLQVTCGPMVDATCVRLPDTEAVGGEYNRLKAVAVGKDALRLKDAGLATEAANAATVWGRPVGDVPVWVDTVWLPRWRRTVSLLTEVAEASPDAAAAVAMEIGGPGLAARHWLAAVPLAFVDDGLKSRLKVADDLWVNFWIRLAGHDPRMIAEVDRRAVEGVVFGNLPHCLSQSSVVDNAAACAAEGMARALHIVHPTARRLGFDAKQWMTLMAGEPVSSDQPAAVAFVMAAKKSAMQAMADAARTARNADSRRAEPQAPGGRNLLVESLRLPAFARTRVEPTHGRERTTYTVATLLKLSPWPALSRPDRTDHPPYACALCGAHSSANGGGSAGYGRLQASGAHELPGEHPALCTRLPMLASFHHRHDAFAGAVAAVAGHCGFTAQTFDKKIFADSSARPADIVVWDGDPRHPDGVYVDVTIVGGGSKGAERAAEAKRLKYATLMATRPEAAFVPFAVSTGGDVHQDAAELVRTWAAGLATLRARQCDPNNGATVDDVWTAVAGAFATVMWRQAVVWHDTNSDRVEYGRHDPVAPQRVRHPPLRTGLPLPLRFSPKQLTCARCVSEYRCDCAMSPRAQPATVHLSPPRAAQTAVVDPHPCHAGSRGQGQEQRRSPMATGAVVGASGTGARSAAQVWAEGNRHSALATIFAMPLQQHPQQHQQREPRGHDGSAATGADGPLGGPLWAPQTMDEDGASSFDAASLGTRRRVADNNTASSPAAEPHAPPQLRHQQQQMRASRDDDGSQPAPSAQRWAREQDRGSLSAASLATRRRPQGYNSSQDPERIQHRSASSLLERDTSQPGTNAVHDHGRAPSVAPLTPQQQQASSRRQDDFAEQAESSSSGQNSNIRVPHTSSTTASASNDSLEGPGLGPAYLK